MSDNWRAYTPKRLTDADKARISARVKEQGDKKCLLEAKAAEREKKQQDKKAAEDEAKARQISMFDL